jgi:Holliday junction resolvase
MARKGYREEYLCKRKLIAEYGKENVIKVAISQFGGDFIVFKEGEPKVEKVVEVKGCHSKKLYLKKRDKEQIERIRGFCESHRIPFEVWVKFPYRDFEVERLV